MKILNFKNIFRKKKVDKDELLNDIFSLVIQVEDKHKKVENAYTELQNNISATIRNEKLLHSLVKVSNILMKNKNFDCKELQEAMDILIEYLLVDKIFISKMVDKTFLQKKFEWQSSGKPVINKNVQISIENSSNVFEVINKGLPYILNKSKSTKKELHFFKRYNIKSACLFPLFVSNKVWGVIGFISYTKMLEWTNDEINIKGLLSSLFSTYIQNRILLTKLNRIEENGYGK